MSPQKYILYYVFFQCIYSETIWFAQIDFVCSIDIDENRGEFRISKGVGGINITVYMILSSLPSLLIYLPFFFLNLFYIYNEQGKRFKRQKTSLVRFELGGGMNNFSRQNKVLTSTFLGL